MAKYMHTLPIATCILIKNRSQQAMGKIVDSGEHTACVNEHIGTRNMLSCQPDSVPLPAVYFSDASPG